MSMQQIESILERLRRASIPTDAIEAIAALVATGNDQAIAPLIEALSYHHPAVAMAAIDGLVQLAPLSVEPLMAAYRNSIDHGIQAYIIQALARIADPRATELLAETVGVAVANHCQGNVRRVAARGLGQIGSKTQDLEIIRQCVQKLTWALLNVEDWALRYAAGVSLQEIDTVEARASLQTALSQEQDKVVLARLKTAVNS